MIRNAFLLAVLAGPLVAWAQNQYQPAVPPPSVNVGGYYSGGGTAAGNALQGMSSVISARGNANLANSAAAINMTQAQSNYIRNRQQATDAYFDMRATNRAATEAERGPRLTSEQLARISQESAPRPLNSMQVDPVTAKISWPALLQDDRYSPERTALEQLVTKQHSYGGLGYSDQAAARKTIDGMFAEMKSQIREVPPQDYTTARSFLRSLNYAMTQTELN